MLQMLQVIQPASSRTRGPETITHTCTLLQTLQLLPGEAGGHHHVFPVRLYIDRDDRDVDLECL